MNESLFANYETKDARDSGVIQQTALGDRLGTIERKIYKAKPSVHFYSKFNLTDQCTIGYAMKIKKKKMFKSKHLVFAHFSTKRGDFFGIDGKIPMFCHKYFLKSKM